MDMHKNARTTPHSRARIAQRVQAGESVAAVARAFSVCDRTARKWVVRAARDELHDRSCRPRRSPRAISAAVMVEIQRLRQLRDEHPDREALRPFLPSHASPDRAWELLTAIDRRQEEEGSAEEHSPYAEDYLESFAAYLGIRDAAWDPRADAEVLAEETGVSVAGFVRRAVKWFRRRGVHVRRVLTDNGTGYRSRVFAAACRAQRVLHRRTRPYTPRTNGKAERFIQTMLGEWAYGVAFHSSAQRTGALPRWLHYYNWHRRHRGLGHPPISRVVTRDNLLRDHI